jgi:hypothetical protein
MRGGFAFALAIAATGWCFLLVVGAFVYPSYSGSGCQSTPGGPMHCGSQTATYFGMNGWGVVGLFGAVAIVSLLVLLALHRVCVTGSGVAIAAAWTGIVLLLGFSWLTGLSIGVLILPAVLLLIASAVVTPKPAPLAR